MIYQTECGLYLNLIFQADKVHWDVMQGIIGNLLTLLSGFYVPVLLGEIYRQRMVTGKIQIVVSAVGEIKEYGKFVQDPDFEWLMIDASYIKVHPHAAGAVGGNQDMGRTKGGSIQKSI